MTTHNNIPGITKISIVPCANLQKCIEFKAIAQIPIGIFTDVEDIPFTGVPTCESVAEYDKNNETEKTTLRFTTLVDIPSIEPLAFVVKDSYKNSFLIGVNEKPYPIVKKTKRTGDPSSSTAVIEYEVTRTSLKSLISVAV